MNRPHPPSTAAAAPGPLQQRLWFLEQLAPEQGYFTAQAVRLRGAVDLPALSAAVSELLGRHPELVVRCLDEDGSPQVVAAGPGTPLRLEEAAPGATPEQVCERLLDSLAAPASRHTFAAALATLAPDDHVLLLVVHQAGGDLASLTGLACELGRRYEEFAGGGTGSRTGPAGSPVPGGDTQAAPTAVLPAGAPPVADAALEAPVDRSRPAVWQPAGVVVPFALPARFGDERPGAALAAAVHTVLARHSGRWRGVLGFREHVVVRPLSLALTAQLSFSTAVQLAADAVDRAAGLDAEDLAREPGPSADTSRNPLYTVLVEVVDRPRPVFGTLTAEWLPVPDRATRHDLVARVLRDPDGGLCGELVYASALFTAEAAARLADRLATLCAALPDQPLGRCDLLPPAERRVALPLPVPPAQPLPERPMADLVLERARATPDALAVECGRRELTYRQLAARSAALAELLRDAGVRRGELVGVLLPRGTDLPAALIGVHRAGAAYLPLDPEHPRERLSQVLADAGVRILVTSGASRPDLVGGQGLRIVDVDTAPAAPRDTVPDTAPVSLDDPAYVIYTSGSTGRPKGVMVTHRSLVTFLWSMRERPGLRPGTVFPAVTTVAFDIAALELFLPLLTGCRIALAERSETQDPERLAALLARVRARVMQATPTTWRLLLDSGWTPPPGFVALSGGERLPAELARRLCAAGAELWDLYGPTETTVWSSVARLRGGEVSDFRAVADTTLYVLDDRLEPVPLDSVGELHIGGAGVAVGYVGRTALTADRFVPDPYAGTPGARMYRTGDLARRRPDGRIEILGRADDQVKIRGVRIEPGEAEAVLADNPGVRAAVVRAVPGPDGAPRLVAYLTPAHPDGPPSQAALRAHCARVLPSVMVPARFVVLDAFPTTPNGKLDVAALPVPQAGQAEEAGGRGPATEEERLVAKAFAEVLECAGLAADDDFFRRGGDSVLAVQAVNRLRAWTGRSLPLAALFEARTVAELARRLALHTDTDTGLPPAARERGGPVPVSFAQQRLWFLQQLDPEDVSYLEPLAVRLPGPFDPERLHTALDQLFERHEVLRTRYTATDDGPPQQIVEPPRPVRPEAEHGDPREVLAAELTRPFDLSAAPPVRLRLVRDDDGTHTVVLVLHHIATDDRTNDILAADLVSLYQGYELPPLPVCYVDYAHWQRARTDGAERERALRFWRDRLAGLERTEVLTDRPRPAVRDTRGATVRFHLPEELTARLRELGEQNGSTPFMTLLAGFFALLGRCTGRDDLAVGVPFSGRDRSETEHLAGVFVNTVMLRVTAPPTAGFRDLLLRTRDGVTAARRHADLPFDLLVEELAPQRDPSRTPLVGVLFTFHDTPELGIGRLPRAAGAKTDLSWHVTRRPDGALDGSVTYATALFDEVTVRGLADQYVQLLHSAVAAPDTPVARLPLLDEPELAAARAHPVPSRADGPHTVHELIAAHRSGVAVIDGARTLTYPELDRQANQLAHRLRALGVRRGDRVAVRLPRGTDLVIALLAVLKAGAAYVPLDPDHPLRRAAWTVADSGAVLLITAGAAQSPAGVRRLDVDDPAETTLTRACPVTAPDIPLTADDLAYVVHTSGSTGQPKGVEVTHGGLVNYTRWARDTLPFGSRRAAAGSVLHTSLAHDLALTGFYPTLAAGAPLRLTAQENAGVQHLADALAEGPYGVLKLTPTHLRLLEQTVEPDTAARAADCLVIGGEELRGEQVATWTRHAPDTLVVNSYGPSEVTVACCTHTVRAGRLEPGPVPIGRPLPGVTVLLLDDALRPVPMGAPGEIHVGGAGVARGYTGDPRLTADRFVPDPYADRPGARLYRTGDLARRQPDGTLVFLGRRDQQLKINGYRVEPGEAESVLAGHPAVRAAAVVADRSDPAGPRLAAHVVPRAGQLGEPELAELRNHLAARLPGHLVPTLWSVLDALPLLANGKLDRRALPRPRPLRTSGREYVAPGTPAERAIAEVWTEVLGVNRVGTRDPFFELGGQSLDATRVATRLTERFAVPVSVRDVFTAQTVAELARLLAARTMARFSEVFGTDAASALPQGVPVPAVPAPAGAPAPLVPVPRDGALPLSFAQQRLWFHEQMNPGGVDYLVMTALRLRGPLDHDRLQRALNEVVARHEVLRTRYVTDDAGEPVQVIGAPSPVPLPVGDVTESGVLSALEAELAEPLPLDAALMLRARLLRVVPEEPSDTAGPAEHVLVLVAHHIAVDAWSNDVLTADLAAAYQGETLPPPKAQYADFAAWQRARLDGPPRDAHLAYWRARLADLPPTELPTDRPRPAQRDPRGAVHRFTVPAATAARIEELARRDGATLFMACLTGYYALLARYTRRTDLAVGVPVAGRDHSALDDAVGCFVNTLVLRVDAAGDPSFDGLLRTVRDAAQDAFTHAELPFEEVVRELAPERDPSRHPLFQLLFAFREPGTRGHELPGVRTTREPVPVRTAKFDLTLELSRRPDGALDGTIEYASGLFDATTVRRLARHYRRILDQAGAAPHTRIGHLETLTAADHAAALRDGSGPPAERPAQGLPELCARQAARTPSAPAVVAGEDVLSYRELDLRANQLAHRLCALGVRPGEPVGVRLPRRTDLVVAILGVLRAGAVYLPLDPRGGPSERVRAMLADADATLVLTDADGTRDAALAEGGRRVLDLAAERAASDALPGDRAPVTTDPDALAYIVYTSGSTGRPKGVGVPHRGIRNRVLWAVEQFGLGPRDRFLQKTTPTFDASVWEFLAPLVSGGTVVLAPPGAERDPAELVRAMVRHDVTVLQGVPSFYRVLADEPGLDRCGALRLLFSAGEALPEALAARLHARVPTATLVNTYGPTESSIDATFWTVTPYPDGRQPEGTVPIGLPLDNCRALVRTPDGAPAPIGVPGELYLSGEGLARGYVGRPALTAASFLPDPYGPPGSRTYRTGDLVRRRADGVLEFLGRVDHQLKIRGVRVEPGEVEAVLARHPAVAAAAVAARPGPDGRPQLVAFVQYRTAAPGHDDGAELRDFLLDRLPETHVPSLFVGVGTLPLTASGKIDRGALPAAPAAPRPAAGAAAAPRTRAERLVADVMADVLGREAVGRDEDFFRIGGHSLLAMRLAGRLRSLFDAPVPVRAVFEHRTAAALARQLTGPDTRDDGAVRPLGPAERDRPQPLSSGQWRLWLLDRVDPAAYLVTWALRLTGRLDRAALEGALEELFARHEILRTRYPAGPDGVPEQRVEPPRPVVLPVTEVTGAPDAHGPGRAAWLLETVRRHAVRPFDLTAAPPVAPRLLRLGPDEHVFVLALHHIVTDEVSEDIVGRELSELYAARVTGRPAALDPPGLQYRDYAAWQRARLADPQAEHGLRHWRDRLAGLRPLDLPADLPRATARDGAGARAVATLPAEVVRPLLAHSREHGATAYVTFLGVLATLLHRFGAGTDIAVGVPVSGRVRPELEGLVGFFVNTVAARVDLSDDPEWTTLLGRVRDDVLDALEHGEVPFDRLVEELAPEREAGRAPLIDVMLEVTETPPAAPVLPGLRTERIRLAATRAKFGLTAFLTARPDGGYDLELEYDTALFSADRAQRLAGHFVTLARAAARQPRQRVGGLALLEPGQRERLLELSTGAPVPAFAGGLPEAFAAQAARTPDAPAVLAADGATLSYAELERRSAALAVRLVAAGVRPEDPVAVCLDRSPDTVVAMLGVLRSGGVYVPLGADQPAVRRAAMLADLRPSAVVTEPRLVPGLDAGRAAVLTVAPRDDAPGAGPGQERPLPPTDPDRLAYMIYTSGSTGRPKAVMVPHGAYLHHCRVAGPVNGLAAGDRGVLLSAPTFDLAMEQMGVPLITGGTVLISDVRFWPPAEVPDRFAAAQVRQVLFTPAYFREVMDHVGPGDRRLDALRAVFVGGEIVTYRDAQRWYEAGLPGRFVCAYGPTETTIVCMTHPVSPDELREAPPDRPVPIGRPVPGTRTYVLDEGGDLAPVGVTGELCVAGPRVSRGYLRRPGLTADRFVPDPFGPPGSRMYRTGDYARYRADGAIEFVGRIDAQVKLRGFRIELGEIEAAVATHPRVRAAAVTAHESERGEKQLVCYVVPRAGATVQPAALREHLRDRVPDYMVPAVWMTLDELPLNSNKKVDRRRLPAPTTEAVLEGAAAAADFTGEVEEAIAEVWTEVLGVAPPSRETGFFELGGHSLALTRLLTRLEDLFDMTIPLRVLFDATSVGAQAAALEELAARLDDGPTATGDRLSDGRTDEF
ncbi:non-ribosomal peptide synthetase [Streptomyces sp. AK010]|uniref:non-ribosomal peptide synthetase n=1 Tax=Streptomyces sp. AK010 TaxID=2723074 RepID=UPI00160C04CF|nr:non-ribosomal peptide synthetase [Streptomyces sp. AK010]MBB6421373.1 amino acid adenylation domain-containing protein [Streptomyces sp. AK010]